MKYEYNKSRIARTHKFNWTTFHLDVSKHNPGSKCSCSFFTGATNSLYAGCFKNYKYLTDIIEWFFNVAADLHGKKIKHKLKYISTTCWNFSSIDSYLHTKQRRTKFVHTYIIYLYEIVRIIFFVIRLLQNCQKIYFPSPPLPLAKTKIHSSSKSRRSLSFNL